MAVIKAFINQQNQATFICPNCRNAKTSDVSKYKKMDRAIRVKVNCPCGHVYTVLLERRRHFRKQVNLPGSYTFGDGGKAYMTVLDLSRSGIRFRQTLRQNLSIGQHISVSFRLDDKENSPIQRDTVVRKIQDLEIGVEFTSQEHYDKLGPYLLYNIG